MELIGAVEGTRTHSPYLMAPKDATNLVVDEEDLDSDDSMYNDLGPEGPSYGSGAGSTVGADSNATGLARKK